MSLKVRWVDSPSTPSSLKQNALKARQYLLSFLMLTGTECLKPLGKRIISPDKGLNWNASLLSLVC